jgi:prepilin-type N-terminal cleavage/methylation domain-containing protein
MSSRRGFTLIETLIASAILVSGLVAVASMFAASIAANRTNGQRAVAAALVSEKLEQFQTARFDSPEWRIGGSLNPLVPVDGWFDEAPAGAWRYLRIWQITGSPTLRAVTIIVCIQPAGSTRPPMELQRGTMFAASTF